MKNVRSSGPQRSPVIVNKPLQDVTEHEFPFTCFNPNAAAFTDFFSPFVSLEINVRVKKRRKQPASIRDMCLQPVFRRRRLSKRVLSQVLK